MGETLSAPKIRAYQCMFVLYPESQQAIIDYCQQNLPCAWALHDKDVYSKDSDDGNCKKGDLKKPHYHFICRFPNQRYFSGIAKELGVPANTINRCSNLYKAYVYLWHGDTPNKYQYEQDIVGTNDFTVPTAGAGVGSEEDAQVRTLLEMPAAELSTTADMARWAYDNGCWATFKSSYAIWRDIRNEQRERSSARDVCFGTNAAHPDNPHGLGWQPQDYPRSKSFEDIVKEP